MVRKKAAFPFLAALSTSLLAASCGFFWSTDLYTLPPLTREQMYQDYDYAAHVIREASPFLTLQKKAYGMDMLQILADRRAEIETISDTGQFNRLMTRTLGALKSQHLDIWLGYAPPDTDILDSNLRQELIYRQWVDGASFTPVNWTLPLVYWNGRYLMVRDAASNGVAVPRGSVLDEIDGVSVFTLSEQYCPHRTPSWDSVNRRFYGSIGYTLPMNLEYADPGGHSYHFTTPSGAPETWTLQASDTVSSTSANYAAQSDPVQYFAGARTLYIRLPTMNPAYVERLAPRIGSESAKGPMDRILIDITNNPGGSDFAWRNLLAMLASEDLALHGAVGVKDSPTVRELLGGTADQGLLSGVPTSVPLLDGEQFLLTVAEETIPKRADSINYSGPIYLAVYNIYSAAGSFLAYSFQNDQLVSVGVPSDLPLGMGIEPRILTLPNSHIRFRIEPAIDLGRTDTVDGLLGRAVEIPIAVSDQDLFAYFNFRGDMNGEESVCTVNPFTRAAIR
jgi:hypothetical protein